MEEGARVVLGMESGEVAEEVMHLLDHVAFAENHLWNYESITASNVVDVAVRRLRRKIDDPFALKLVETLYGLGYRLRTPWGND